MLQKTVLNQACRLLVRAEKCRDLDMVVRLSNSASRLLAGLQHGGLNPRKKPLQAPKPSLDEHLKGLAEGGSTP